MKIVNCSLDNMVEVKNFIEEIFNSNDFFEEEINEDMKNEILDGSLGTFHKLLDMNSSISKIDIARHIKDVYEEIVYEDTYEFDEEYDDFE